MIARGKTLRKVGEASHAPVRVTVTLQRDGRWAWMAYDSAASTVPNESGVADTYVEARWLSIRQRVEQTARATVSGEINGALADHCVAVAIAAVQDFLLTHGETAAGFNDSYLVQRAAGYARGYLTRGREQAARYPSLALDLMGEEDSWAPVTGDGAQWAERMPAVDPWEGTVGMIDLIDAIRTLPDPLRTIAILLAQGLRQWEIARVLKIDHSLAGERIAEARVLLAAAIG